MKEIEPLAKRGHYVVAAVVSALGVVVCLGALAGFILTVATNRLRWYPGLTIQEHYLAIGRSYTQGFVVGFFLCFFMVVGALALSRFVERYRRRSRHAVRASSSGARVA
ncbi:MAG TPA: hypothetical protein VD788_07630 [Candidatus Polarisedimenticolaceae bacterium]|nr:hypothetical protein [Candidatus Polarisedimenticolaceae bacterium]